MTVLEQARRAATRAGITAVLVAFMAAPRMRQEPYVGFRMLRSLDPVHRSLHGRAIRHVERGLADIHPRTADRLAGCGEASGVTAVHDDDGPRLGQAFGQRVADAGR